ncbi:hypothetical protein PF003_g33505 [Phytophthora fragariae]|nr:hypothetical protein PF003_g33505 [Phytophthora fragariae]
MATHPTFYVGLLKPYHPAGLLRLRSRLWSQNTAERPLAIIRRDLPREAGQAQEAGAGSGARAATRRASCASK